MKVVVGLPYLRDVCRKARSGCFGPFVSYEYFPSTYQSRKEEKEPNSKKKDKEETKNKNYKRREEKQTEKKRHNITNLAA